MGWVWVWLGYGLWYGLGLGNDRNFGSVRFGVRLILAGSVRQKFCRTFCHSISGSLTIYGYKADRLCISLQQIVFSVTARFHNTYLDNSVLRCETFGLLRGRILYSCIDFIVLAKYACYVYVSLKHDILCF